MRTTRHNTLFPCFLLPTLTRAQLLLNVSNESARGPLPLRFAADDRAGDLRVVLALAAEAGRALLAGRVGVLVGVARGRRLVGTDHGHRVLVGAGVAGV